jgi:hypothetical protein
VRKVESYEEFLELWGEGGMLIDRQDADWCHRKHVSSPPDRGIFNYWAPWTTNAPVTARPEKPALYKGTEEKVVSERVAAAAVVKKDKPRMDLLPLDVLLGVAKVLTFGAKKYADDSWKRAPFEKRDYKAALLRHLEADDREVLDEESGLHHCLHLACDAMMYAWHRLQETKP